MRARPRLMGAKQASSFANRRLARSKTVLGSKLLAGILGFALALPAHARPSVAHQQSSADASGQTRPGQQPPRSGQQPANPQQPARPDQQRPSAPQQRPGAQQPADPGRQQPTRPDQQRPSSPQQRPNAQQPARPGQQRNSRQQPNAQQPARPGQQRPNSQQPARPGQQRPNSRQPQPGNAGSPNARPGAQTGNRQPPTPDQNTQDPRLSGAPNLEDLSDSPVPSAAQDLEELSVAGPAKREPLDPIAITGWSLVLGGLALGVTGSTCVGFAQVQEGRAQRILRRFDPTSGAHPVFGDVKKDYQDHLDRAATLRTVALSTGISAGVFILSGAVITMLAAGKKGRKLALSPTPGGVHLRF